MSRLLVSATDPEGAPDEPGYREVFATEVRTPGETIAKIRALVGGRRMRSYRTTGVYKEDLAYARWAA